MPVLYQGGAGGSGGAQVGISTGGNTSGDTGLASSQLVLVGSNGITLSGSTNGGSMTLTMSGVTQTVQTQVLSGGISTGGNTSGDTGLVSRQLVFAGGNNVTLSGSTNGSSMTITISAPNTAAQLSAGISGGNTSGDTGVVNSRIVLAGGNNITLSGSTNGGSMTVTVSAGNAAAPTLSQWNNLDPSMNYTGQNTANGSLMIMPMNWGGPFPGNMTANTIRLLFSGSMTATDASTAAKTYSVSLLIYTLSASSTLNMLYQASTSWGSNAAASDFSSMLHGARFLTFHSSQFSNSASAATTPSFSQTQYWMGAWIRSSGESYALSWLVGSLNPVIQMSGTVGTSVATAVSMGPVPFMGRYSSASTDAAPVTINLTKIQHGLGYLENRPVPVFLDNLISAH